MDSFLMLLVRLHSVHTPQLVIERSHVHRQQHPHDKPACVDGAAGTLHGAAAVAHGNVELRAGGQPLSLERFLKARPFLDSHVRPADVAYAAANTSTRIS